MNCMANLQERLEVMVRQCNQRIANLEKLRQLDLVALEEKYKMVIHQEKEDFKEMKVTSHHIDEMFVNEEKCPIVYANYAPHSKEIEDHLPSMLEEGKFQGNEVNKVVDELNSCHHEAHEEICLVEEEYEEVEFSKVVSIILDTNNFGSYLMCLFKALCNHSLVSLYRMLNGKEQERQVGIWKTSSMPDHHGLDAMSCMSRDKAVSSVGLEMIHPIGENSVDCLVLPRDFFKDSKRNIKLGFEANSLHALQYLLIQLVLQVFFGPAELHDVSFELSVCCGNRERIAGHQEEDQVVARLLLEYAEPPLKSFDLRCMILDGCAFKQVLLRKINFRNWKWYYRDFMNEREKEHPSQWIKEWKIAWILEDEDLEGEGNDMNQIFTTFLELKPQT